MRAVDRARAIDIAAIEGNIERRQAALDARLDVDRITPDEYRERTRPLAAERATCSPPFALTAFLPGLFFAYVRALAEWYAHQVHFGPVPTPSPTP